MDDGGGSLIGALTGGFMLVIWIGVYVYHSLALMTIATKTGTENPWMAWIPILNLWIMVQIAEKEAWWIILFFVPIVGVIVTVIVWMAIAERVGKPSWWGILVIVPVVQIVVPGYLAWG